MKLGIVGLPNVGKSTLFNSLTKAGAESANYPFCTIDPNVGIVMVPDERLTKLEQLYHSKKVVPAVIEFVDIAGLVKGASKGEGLGNQFLSNIREVDAIVHVVRCFDDSNIVHVDGSVSPLRDIETINFELIFSDIEVLDRRIAKQSRAANNDKTIAKEVALLKRLKEHLEEGKLAKTFEVADEDEAAVINECNLLTIKPVIFAANVNEDSVADDGATNPYVQEVREYAAATACEVFVVCAQIEQEISELDDDEKKEFLQELGMDESGLEKLIKASYSLLGLLSFLTAGEDECRAWTIKKGTKAPGAAGKIHTDFERGFIRAEVVNYDHLMEYGSVNAAKEKGLVRSEGKEYVVQDGDVILFKFNV
ncbi:MAG: redox-regulated ATPase YchF [Lachnospiraceae bacterium]